MSDARVDGIIARLEDARQLLSAGRMEGFLHAVLTAASGASRLRYPLGCGLGDREAFQRFFDEQVDRTGTPRIRVRLGQEEFSFGYVLYKLFRCPLAHEGSLPEAARLCADPSDGHAFFRLDSLEPLGVTISNSIVVLIVDMVARAPEIAHAATSVRAQIMSVLPTWRPEERAEQGS